MLWRRLYQYFILEWRLKFGTMFLLVVGECRKLVCTNRWAGVTNEHWNAQKRLSIRIFWMTSSLWDTKCNTTIWLFGHNILLLYSRYTLIHITHIWIWLLIVLINWKFLTIGRQFFKASWNERANNYRKIWSSCVKFPIYNKIYALWQYCGKMSMNNAFHVKSFNLRNYKQIAVSYKQLLKNFRAIFFQFC